MNEYDEIVSLNNFLEMVANKQKENSPGMFEYCENINGYRFANGEFS